jgi:CheY-like chemotaxis protein
MSTDKRENIEQIPKEGNLEVQKAISEQGGVEGQRKEVNIADYANAAALARCLLLDINMPKMNGFKLYQEILSSFRQSCEDMFYYCF